MKIYEIGTGYTPIPAAMGAATEIVVEGLTRSLRRQGADVQILDIAAEKRAAHDLPIREVGVPRCFSGTDVKLGIMHKLKRVVYSLALAGELKKILKQETEPVVLHFHNQYNLFFFLKLVSASLRKKARIAYTVHSYIWPGEWEEIRDTIQKRYFQEVFCVQNADDVLVLNEKTAEHFTTHLGVREDAIKRIDNGVNTDVYHILDQDEIGKAQEALGLKDRRIILQVGSVCDRKNQLGALRKLVAYLKEHPDVTFVYAGGIIDPEYQDSISRFAAEHQIKQQVVYAGELRPGEELNLYYNIADVTVFPSKIESFGLVILESISCGTPVIVQNKPHFELENGCIVCSGEEDFIRNVERLLQQPGADQIAREEVVERYGWDKIARDHMKIWN